MPESVIPRTASAYNYPLLIGHLLHTPLATTPDREIVYADVCRYTYRELRRRIGRLASALHALGVRRGSTVAVMDWDSHRYLECFFAVPMLGAVLHTVNVRLSPAQVLYTINHAQDDVILVHTDFLPMLEQIWERVRPGVALVLLQDSGPAPESPLEFEVSYEAMLSAGDPEFQFDEFDENTRATTFYTTGTTGDPKGVYYSHRQLMLHTLAVTGWVGTAAGHGRFHRDDVYMPITPMFHVHAWGFPYVATLMGVKQVYPGRYEPDRVLRLVEREGVTFTHCVPTILHMLLSSPRAEQVDLSAWKLVIGGAALPKSLARRAIALGIDIYGGYGLSETCPILTTAHLDAAMLRGDEEQQLAVRVKAGRPLPLVDLRVVDEAMHDVPHDARTTGEVVVRAPWLTQGYWKEPERSEALWRGGYLHTGDIGHIDPAGYLQVTDRLKDVIKSGGEWVSSLALEDLVSGLEGVGEVAVIGVPDERWGERPLVIVVPAAGAAEPLSGERVKAHLEAYADEGVIARWVVPERVEIVSAIEKTSVGKLDKKRLRAKYVGGESS